VQHPIPPMLSNHDHMKAVGSRLRRLAAALDLQLVDMAKEMGCTKQTLNGWLKGEGYPNDYMVYRLCRIHRVNFDYLFLGDWSQLPAKVAARLEPGFAALEAGPEAPGPSRNENPGENETLNKRAPRLRVG